MKKSTLKTQRYLVMEIGNGVSMDSVDINQEEAESYISGLLSDGVAPDDILVYVIIPTTFSVGRVTINS